jgi:hypothetical protein
VNEQFAVIFADNEASANDVALEQALYFARACALSVVSYGFYDWCLFVDVSVHNCTVLLFKNLSIALTEMNIRFPILEKGMSLLAILCSIHLRDTPRYSCACFLLSQP